MNGEITKTNTDWSNIVSLRDYFDSRLSSVEKETMLAKESMEKRLEGMNEFRDSLRDQSNKFITREEMRSLVLDIQGLRESRAELYGKASQSSVYFAYLISIIGFLVGVINLFLK